MWGSDEGAYSLFSYGDLESRVRKEHPLRTTRSVVDDALADMARDFSARYSRVGRP
jgi:hypothetical protein